MPTQKVDSDGNEPVITRPLKTGQNFVLVLPRKRFVYRHWDKENYLPGEEATLILEGEGIGDEKYEFIIQTTDKPDGAWQELAKVKAVNDGDKATARFKIPKPKPKGKVTKVEWKRTKAVPGDSIGMHVEAENYEGGFLSIHVEKQNEKGEWEVYTRWQGAIEHGKYDTAFDVPKKPPGPKQWPGANVTDLEFLDTPTEEQPVWMQAKTENLDNSQLQFVLERTDAKGDWHSLGQAVSTVAKNLAKNMVPVPLLAADGSSQLEDMGAGGGPVQFAKDVFADADEITVWVDPAWLQGQGFELTLERRVMVEGESWKPFTK
ncbi:MAG TPA: hypothetical protein VL117_06825, partial [Thermoleophilia bacterium]|nr:hypothetical protein [Thermoleophilia bacterium]